MRKFLPVSFVILLMVGLALFLISTKNGSDSVSAKPNELQAAPIRPMEAIEVPVTQAEASVYPEPDIAMYWNMDGSGNELTNRVGRAKEEKIQFVTGRSGNPEDFACEFNGTDSALVIPNDVAFSLTNNLSIAAWVKVKEQKSQNVFRIGAGLRERTSPFGLSFSATGDVVFTINVQGNVEQARKKGYPINEWIFLVGTVGGGKATLYVDGQLAASLPINGELTVDGLSPVLIGTRLRLPADTLNGVVDDVTIFSVALSAERVASIYERSRQGMASR